MYIVRKRISLEFSLRIFFAVMIVFSLSGCISLSNYSAKSYVHLTELKAYNLKLYDDFTTEKPQSVDINKVTQIESTGDLKFREAIVYAEGMNDKLRTDNIKELQSMFEDNVSWLKKGKTFSKAYSREMKEQTVRAYNLAIKGEKIHYGAPN